MSKLEINTGNTDLISEISLLIEQSQRHIATQANSALTQLFWQIGKRINDEILLNKRADYGKQIVVTLSEKLMTRYGRSFEEKNLRRMLQFSEQFEDFSIVVTLSRQLSWSHFLVLLPIKQAEAKQYYANLSSVEYWSVRDLRKQIASKAFERNEIANPQLSTFKPELLNTFIDPYILDFLNLKNTYLEQDLERAILHELEAFILELGKGFAFMERQKRMIIDGDDFYLPCLSYHLPSAEVRLFSPQTYHTLYVGHSTVDENKVEMFINHLRVCVGTN